MSSNNKVFLAHNGHELVLRTEKPNIAPHRSRVLVIGGGVTGLTTAWALLDAGFPVTVVADKWASPNDRITSQVAGALWEWPPAVCGKHTNAASLRESKRWSLTTYRILGSLAEVLPPEVHGTRWTMANFFFTSDIDSMPVQLDKLRDLMALPDLRGFKRDKTLNIQLNVGQNNGIADSYQHLAPIIDTDVYMAWLTNLVSFKGAHLITDRVHGDLLAKEEKLHSRYGADVIVNASGLGAFELANDPTVYPLRGALIRVINDGIRFPKVEQALCVAHDDTHGEDAEDIIYIVPRNERTLVLGGVAQANILSLDLTLDSPEIVRMRQRCNKFLPGLENAEYVETDPLVEGLRPSTRINVRVGKEKRKTKSGLPSRIVHSYGHGGSGFSLSFGCAGDVLRLVEDIISGTRTNVRPGVPDAHL